MLVTPDPKANETPPTESEEPPVTASSRDSCPPVHPTVTSGAIGVLLVNLGTPDSPDKAAVRRYLAEFLSDRRVIELTPWLWNPILHGVILRTRPARVAEAYLKPLEIGLGQALNSNLFQSARIPVERSRFHLQMGANPMSAPEGFH